MSSRERKRTTVYKNQYQEIYTVHVEFEGGAKDIFVTDYGPRAAMVVEGEAGILLSRQYRYLIDRVSWEIPGGKAEAGETMDAAAARECLEETGVRCGAVKPLIKFHPGLDTLHNPTHIFYATEFEVVTQKLADLDESLEVVWIPLAQCLEMVFSGDIVDSLSIIALLSYSKLKEAHTSA